VAWYIGTIGFVLYFGHRTHIETKRANLVKNLRLVQALRASDIEEDKKLALVYLTKTTLTSKARFNSAFIFILSLAVLIASLVMEI